mmetsp:Transcript_4763/g.11875  ORF Transcript_4763/g.11875 Transcript_4763/m.11875 type:complete len:115 (+) Transcript_4763:896-1240(+)
MGAGKPSHLFGATLFEVTFEARGQLCLDHIFFAHSRRDLMEKERRQGELNRILQCWCDAGCCSMHEAGTVLQIPRRSATSKMLTKLYNKFTTPTQGKNLQQAACNYLNKNSTYG